MSKRENIQRRGKGIRGRQRRKSGGGARER